MYKLQIIRGYLSIFFPPTTRQHLGIKRHEEILELQCSSNSDIALCSGHTISRFMPGKKIPAEWLANWDVTNWFYWTLLQREEYA
jgi:hypothetical protein